VLICSLILVMKVKRGIPYGEECPWFRTFVCFTCKIKDPKKMCGRCRSARYCNEVCQAKHWKIHKVYCKPVKNN